MFVEALTSAADASNPLITVVTEANKFDSEEERTSPDDRLTSRNDSNPNLVTKYPVSTRPFFATKDVHENSEEAFFANVLYTPGRAFLGKGKGQSFGPCVLRKQSPVIGPPQSPALEVKQCTHGQSANAVLTDLGNVQGRTFNSISVLALCQVFLSFKTCFVSRSCFF